ncbi:hypothetical protein GWI33_014059 [Rhynchophorus ferrugineus]|uniref:Dipeptidase n=1 Tax=Rhynchophorus ferrugineus TaxID=354439 RepID=A0A834IFT2_RHYFE|nr:hypothetical protein GWI33_014059 [Rhynchophorus ferrugineus]
MTVSVIIVVFWFFLAEILGVQSKATDVPGRTALDNFPLIDGHNDLPYKLKMIYNNQIEKYDFLKEWQENDEMKDCKSCHTDYVKLTKGKLGAQFWSAYIKCTNNTNPVSDTIEQIDLIKRLVDKYSGVLYWATKSDDIAEAFKQKKIASFIGVEGGHSIDNRLSVLRAYYELGVRYLTLTHFCNLDWADSTAADSTPDTPKKNLTEFGKIIIAEMNRLGMMVDLAHVSRNVMIDAIKASKAPVIFSHSSSRYIYDHVRNVNDDVLQLLKENDGIIMVNFFSGFIGGNNTIYDVINHINHIVEVIGVDHVGLGADYDGVHRLPKGLEDVSTYSDLFDLLKVLNPQIWTIENLEKLAGRNLVRVFRKVEQVKLQLKDEKPREDIINL